jgi:hypothetical protein
VVLWALPSGSAAAADALQIIAVSEIVWPGMPVPRPARHGLCRTRYDPTTLGRSVSANLA